MTYLVNQRVPGLDAMATRKVMMSIEGDYARYGGIAAYYRGTGEYRTAFGREYEVQEPVIMPLTTAQHATVMDYLAGEYTRKLSVDIEAARAEQFTGGRSYSTLEEIRELEEAEFTEREIMRFARRIGAELRGEVPPAPPPPPPAPEYKEEEYTRPPPPPPTPTPPPSEEFAHYVFQFPMGMMGKSLEERARIISETKAIENTLLPSRRVSGALIGRYRRAAEKLRKELSHLGTFAFTTITENGETTLQIRIPKDIPAETLAHINDIIGPILHPQARPKAAAPQISPMESYLRDKLYREYVGRDSVYNRVAGPVMAMVKPFARTMAECARGKGLTETQIDDMWDHFDWHSSPAARAQSPSSLAQSLKDNIDVGFEEFMERTGCMTAGDARATVEKAVREGLESVKKDIEDLQERVFTASDAELQTVSDEARELQDELRAFTKEERVTPAEVAEEVAEEPLPPPPAEKASEVYTKLKKIFDMSAAPSLSEAEIMFSGSMKLRIGSPGDMRTLVAQGAKDGYIRKTAEGLYEMV